jgi:alkyl hydroperoxide reductase subunit D
MTIVKNDTWTGLAERIRLRHLPENAAMKALLETDHRYLKDLKINVSNALAYETLSGKEAALLSLAVAANDKNDLLIESFKNLSNEEGVDAVQIAEVFSCVSLMNINNTFYRFRHFTNKDFYNLTPAGIKMSIMSAPATGKEFFELLSLVLSSINGCEMCVNAHEASLIKHGTAQQRIFDAVRLASIIKGLCVLVK